ncbi:outer membrane beta-barrel protein [Armatimonas rosea]|uniref:Outer membrane protein beta-barrel domain-containing protein n=1 Tax=Armatimonas rosea TaxID=685828 RepID=A0A7W9STD3_ARMRO|nr:outer membrane beta-barrel protein [Armatimonas rosea]MBB6052497.1 hypothetical protein [Armatimonas rosea]
MKSLLCAALLGALALPVSAQSNPRFSASAGSFFPGGKAGDRYSNTSFTYQPRLKALSLGLPVSTTYYLDTTRRKLTTGTGTSAVTTTQWMQGFGVLLRAHVLPVNAKGLYETLGVGIYQRHFSDGTTSTTGYGPGGKIGLGYQVNSMFVEADYTAVARIKGNNQSGFGMRVGVRF